MERGCFLRCSKRKKAEGGFSDYLIKYGLWDTRFDIVKTEKRQLEKFSERKVFIHGGLQIEMGMGSCGGLWSGGGFLFLRRHRAGSPFRFEGTVERIRKKGTAAAVPFCGGFYTLNWISTDHEDCSRRKRR